MKIIVNGKVIIADKVEVIPDINEVGKLVVDNSGITLETADIVDKVSYETLLDF